MRGSSGLRVQALPRCPRSRRIPAQQPGPGPGPPSAPARGPTYQEVEDGHVNDVEEAVAAVVRVDLFDGVAVKRIDLPPEGEKKSWGWKSQDGEVLGALLTPALAPQVPAPSSQPGLPAAPGLQAVGSWVHGGPRGKDTWQAADSHVGEKKVLGLEHPFCWALH